MSENSVTNLGTYRKLRWDLDSQNGCCAHQEHLGNSNSKDKFSRLSKLCCTEEVNKRVVIAPNQKRQGYAQETQRLYSASDHGRLSVDNVMQNVFIYVKK